MAFMYSPKKVLIGSVAALALGAGFMMAAPQAQAAPPAASASTSAASTHASSVQLRSSPRSVDRATAPLTAPVTGTFTDASGGQGVFAGNFTPTGFAASGDQVIATGTLTGTLTDSAGTALGPVTKTVSPPVETGASPAVAPAASCQILDLRIQPIDLNLLGLVVH